MCPLGGYCVGNNITWKDVRPKYGWWRLHETNENTHNHPPKCLNTEANQKKALPICIFQKCLYPHACHGAPNPDKYKMKRMTGNGIYDPANVTSNFKETCNEKQGYRQNCTDRHTKNTRCRLCATCKPNYKRTGNGVECKQCPEPYVNKLWLTVGFLILIIGTTILIYMEINSEASPDETSDTIKKIILNFLQIVSLAGSLPLQWPNTVIVMYVILKLYQAIKKPKTKKY